jgi:hypothetical protein
MRSISSGCIRPVTLDLLEYEIKYNTIQYMACMKCNFYGGGKIHLSLIVSFGFEVLGCDCKEYYLLKCVGVVMRCNFPSDCIASHSRRQYTTSEYIY